MYTHVQFLRRLLNFEQVFCSSNFPSYYLDNATSSDVYLFYSAFLEGKKGALGPILVFNDDWVADLEVLGWIFNWCRNFSAPFLSLYFLSIVFIGISPITVYLNPLSLSSKTQSSTPLLFQVGKTGRVFKCVSRQDFHNCMLDMTMYFLIFNH